MKPNGVVRTFPKLCVSVALLVIFGLFTAPSAQANQTLIFNVDLTNCTFTTDPNSAVTVRQGDRLTFQINTTNTGTCRFVLAGGPAFDPGSQRLAGWSWDSSDLSGSLAIFFSVTGNITRIAGVGSVNALGYVNQLGQDNFDASAGSLAINVLSGEGSAPDFTQQFGVAEDEDCTEIPDSIEVFNVSRSGGWTKSWAQWPHEGQGGFVCTRLVRYEPSIQGWVPRL